MLFSEDAQKGWQEEVLVTRARKGTLFQATKGLRVESQVLNEMVLMKGYSGGYSGQAATLLRRILGFAHSYLWDGAMSPSDICLRCVL